MKKGIYIFTILIASLALLALSVIPHHHHEDDICFEKSHCDTDCDHRDHSSSEHNHKAEKGGEHQDSENNAHNHCCLLNVEILLPQQHNETEAAYIIYLDDYTSIAAWLTNKSNEDQILQSQQTSHSPPILPFYSRHVIGSPGLRAPPVC